MTGQRLLDLLAIGRVANLPTVWSNTLVGFLLAWTIDDPEIPFEAGLQRLPLLLVGVTFAYLFGTFLNDWKDADFDGEYRPERAIPSGRWSRPVIGWIAAGFVIVSFACFLPESSRQPLVPALGAALLTAILLYTVLHKRTPLAIIPMGICRSLLYLLGYFVVVSVPDPESRLPSGGTATSPLDLVQDNALVILALMTLGIFTYVAGLTLAARYESHPGQLRVPRAFLRFLILFCILTHTWWWIWKRPPFLDGWHLAIPTLLCLLPFCVWTGRSLFVLRKSVPDFVSRALAGLCLLDLLAFAGIAATMRTGWHALDASPLYLALVPLSCFLLALLLQRLAPAT